MSEAACNGNTFSFQLPGVMKRLCWKSVINYTAEGWASVQACKYYSSRLIILIIICQQRSQRKAGCKQAHVFFPDSAIVSIDNKSGEEWKLNFKDTVDFNNGQSLTGNHSISNVY